MLKTVIILTFSAQEESKCKDLRKENGNLRKQILQETNRLHLAQKSLKHEEIDLQNIEKEIEEKKEQR